ncbi:unnamed protein product [Caenorhabditis bovis]|uniref:Uncharacterized protein n=1 Tax=Caenorhabditis bovis TaxID=2654633 RepID=A0A8S1E8D5_9PELO|nr:unnamed protein product [Caenorhabditis bovis]
MGRKHKCLVCGDGSNSLHFGALTCRACAAFFRRKVVSKKAVVGNCEKKCKIDAGVRKLCAFCRYNKCLAVGMQKSAVFMRVSSCHEMPSFLAPEESETGQKYVILQRLSDAYDQLKQKREIIFPKKLDQQPRQSNYIEMNEVFFKDIALIMKNVVPIFEVFSKLAPDQQKILVSNFLSPFIVLENGLRSKENLLILPDGSYVDREKIDEYYLEFEKNEKSTPTKPSKILGRYWKIHEKSIVSQLNYIKLERFEFLYLSALIFWDTGLPSQSDECTSISRTMRQKIVAEMTEYYKNYGTHSDNCLRLAQVLMILETIQKLINTIHEIIEIAQLYELYDFHTSIFETFPSSTNMSK